MPRRIRNVPNRMSQIGNVPAKLVLSALLHRRVVPAVEDGRGEDIFQRAQRPVEIGVHEAEWNVVNGPTQIMTLGEMPAIRG